MRLQGFKQITYLKFTIWARKQITDKLKKKMYNMIIKNRNNSV